MVLLVRIWVRCGACDRLYEATVQPDTVRVTCDYCGGWADAVEAIGEEAPGEGGSAT